MIQYIEGNIFESPAQVIVNTVNTVGVMGKGIALAFKQRYPLMFSKYREACEKKLLTPGKLMLIYEPDHWIMLFPTKENWRNPSKLEYIEKGLMKFRNSYAEKNIHSIAFPKLGCGNGALSWESVKPLMEKYLKSLPIDVYIYTGVNPDEPPEHKNQKEITEWMKENSKDLSFNAIAEDIKLSCAILPFRLDADGKIYKVSFRENLSFDGADESIFVSEEEFFTIWTDLRKNGIAAQSEDNEKKNLVFALLHSMGYLSKIKIYDEKTGLKKSGYQVNEGTDRVNSFKEI